MFSVLPLYFCIAALVILLIARERQHAQIVRGLIDKILIQRDLEPIPDDHPLAEVLATVTRKAEEPDEPKQTRVRFRIPGMDAFEAMSKRPARK